MKISSRSYYVAVLLGFLCLMGLWLIACVGCAGVQGPAPLQARQHVESWYADALAKEMGAMTEARMRNGTRCDVLATHFAIEVEFASKWAEAVGQSLNYASQTGKRGAVALILEKESDERFLARLREVISWHQLPLKVVVLRPFNTESLTIEFPEGMENSGRVLPSRLGQASKARWLSLVAHLEIEVPEPDFHTLIPPMDFLRFRKTDGSESRPDQPTQ